MPLAYYECELTNRQLPQFDCKESESLRLRPPLAMALLKANGGGAIGLGHVIPVHYMPGISLPARELFFVWVRVNGFPVCGFVLL